MKKVISIGLTILLLAIGVLGATSCGNGNSANDAQPQAGKIIANKMGLTGTLSPYSTGKKLSVSADVLRGIMTSPNDPPPLIKVTLKNNSNGVIKTSGGVHSGYYRVAINSLDKDGYSIGTFVGIDINLNPRDSRTTEVELFQSLETKGFSIRIDNVSGKPDLPETPTNTDYGTQVKISSINKAGIKGDYIGVTEAEGKLQLTQDIIKGFDKATASPAVVRIIIKNVSYSAIDVLPYAEYGYFFLNIVSRDRSGAVRGNEGISFLGLQPTEMRAEDVSLFPSDDIVSYEIYLRYLKPK